MADSSPRKSPWKNPKDLLKLRRKRLHKNDDNNAETQKSAVKPAIRACQAPTNPFKSSPQVFYGQTKRLKPNPPEFDDCMTEPPANIFSALDDVQSDFPRSIRAQLDFSCLMREEKSVAAVVNDSKFRTLQGRPTDLSVGTKLRITSSKPFPWSASESSVDICTGQNWFVTDTPFDPSQAQNSDYQAAWLQKSSLFYSYPNLPWIHNFPRKQVRHGFLRASDIDAPSIASLGETIREAYRSKWSQTFQQLFQTLRTQQTPMFYVFCPSFTVLFLGENVGSNDQIRAILTPTTVGFRHALSADGVEFQILKTSRDPVETKLDSPFTCPAAFSMMEFPGTNTETDEKMATSDDEDNNENWLDRIKMSPRFSRKFKTFSKCSGAALGDTSESAVITLTTEASVGLYNFLLNSQLCWANTGSQAGMPPTLLSPKPFRGGSLERLEIRQTVSKQADGEFFLLDLVGSVLPHNVFSLLSLLETTMKDFSLSLFGSQPYEIFNQLELASPNTNANGADKVMMSSGADFYQSIRQCNLTLTSTRDLHFSSGIYKIPSNSLPI